MLALFEFFFKYRPLLFQKGSIVLHPPWPWYATLVLAVLALGVPYVIYRRTAGIVPFMRRLALSGLRAAFLLVLLLISLQPTLVLHSVLPQQSFLAVAYDSSKSMEIRDGTGGTSRLDEVKRILNPAGNPLVAALSGKFKLRFFRFSSTAERTASFEDASKHGNVTSLDHVLDQIAGELNSVPVSGIVLLTDGADNHASDMTATANRLRARNIPVYPVGIGMTEFPQDLEILRVTAPRRALKDSMIEADVSVRSSGFAGRRAKLVVKERDRTLQTQEITLGGDGEVRNHRVNFTCDSAGAKIFSVRLDPIQGEIVPENNEQTILVQVMDEQPPVLYVEGEPRWIYGFVRRAADADKNLHLVTLLRQADGKFLRQGVENPAMLEKGFPTDKSELFRYKAIILGTVEASFFTFDQLRMISDFVSQRGGGFLMLGGRNSFAQGGYINTPLEDMLPVILQDSQTGFQEAEFKARLTAFGADHPITRMASGQAENRKRWEAAPPLFGMNPTAGAKPGGTVLLQSALVNPRGQNPVLLAFQRFGRGKSMALTTASTWRWRMDMDSKDNFHELFWKQLLRWLVSEAADPVTIETDKHSYAPEEAVTLQADVSDSTFLRLNNAQAIGQVKSPSGNMAEIPLKWDQGKEGFYTGSYKPREEGIYEVSVEANLGSKSLGSSKGFFRVSDSSDEFHNAVLNESLLKRLASDTGGKYYRPGEVQALAGDVGYIDNGVARLEEKELWDMPFLFLLLLGSAGLEWTLRKRKGLA